MKDYDKDDKEHFLNDPDYKRLSHLVYSKKQHNDFSRITIFKDAFNMPQEKTQYLEKIQKLLKD